MYICIYYDYEEASGDTLLIPGILLFLLLQFVLINSYLLYICLFILEVLPIGWNN